MLLKSWGALRSTFAPQAPNSGGAGGQRHAGRARQAVQALLAAAAPRAGQCLLCSSAVRRHGCATPTLRRQLRRPVPRAPCCVLQPRRRQCSSAPWATLRGQLPQAGRGCPRTTAPLVHACTITTVGRRRLLWGHPPAALLRSWAVLSPGHRCHAWQPMRGSHNRPQWRAAAGAAPVRRHRRHVTAAGQEARGCTTGRLRGVLRTSASC